MGYVFCNPNPDGILVDDCVFRALSIVMNTDWETTFVRLSVLGLKYHNRTDSNYVWGKYLEENGFKKYIIPNTCPDCYTIRQFCKDNKHGRYLLATGEHVVAVIDGNYMDTFDSGDYVPVYYWKQDN